MMLAELYFGGSGCWIRAAGVLLIYASFSLSQRFLRRLPVFKVVALQLNLLVLAAALAVLMPSQLAGLHPHLLAGVQAATVFLLVSIGLRLADALCFGYLLPRRRPTPVPVVLRDIVYWTSSAVALFIVVRAFFPTLNFSVLAVSSLVAGYIIGNATQDTLGNLVAGLALNTERPFMIGDWVTVGGHTGQVVDTTWRATRLRTQTEDYIVIPNATIAREPISNFSRPTTCHGCTVTVGVSYDTPPNLVREVILGVVRDVPHVRSEPAPWVNLVSYADFSVNFTIKFYIDDFPRLDEIQSILLDRLWYAFRREKIDIPFPVRDVRIRPAAEAAAPQSGPPTAATLRRVDLFQSLAPHEVEQLAGSARRQVFGKGEILCRQGEEGGTLYAICSGGVSITVRQTDGRETVVAHLGPDAFFGEMSLLTGEKRSATVTAERDTEVLMVSKTALAPLLESNTDLASRLAEAVEHRTADRLARMNADTAAVATSSHSALVQRIRRFFGLG